MLLSSEKSHRGACVPVVRITFWEHKQSLNKMQDPRDRAESSYFQLTIPSQTTSGLLSQIPLLSVRTVVLSEKEMDGEMVHWAYIVARRIPNLEELRLEYEFYDDMHDTSTEIQGPTGTPLGKNPTLSSHG